MVNFTEEYIKWDKEFRKKFGQPVPLAMIPSIVTTEEMIAKLKECIEESDPDILCKFNVEIDKTVLY